MNVVPLQADDSRLFLEHRRQAYVTVFGGPDGKVVLADLARFCRATQSTFHQDPRLAAQLDGRREVFLRIAEHLNLSFDELWDFKNGR